MSEIKVCPIYSEADSFIRQKEAGTRIVRHLLYYYLFRLSTRSESVKNRIVVPIR